MNVPPQAPPVARDLLVAQAPPQQSGTQSGPAGVIAAQTACDSLRGLAQQMCYAVRYGASL